MEEGLLVAEKEKEISQAEKQTKESEEETPKYPKLTTKQRINICKKCPLLMPKFYICNENLWLNPETLETSKGPRVGFVCGCGCAVLRKAKQPDSHCHLGRW